MSERLGALYTALDFLSQLRSGEEDKVWSRVAEKLAAATGATAATYFIYMPKQRQLIARYGLGATAFQLEGAPLSVDSGLCGWVATHREPLLVSNAPADKRFNAKVDEATGFKTKTVLALPLFDQLDLAGVIELINKEGGPFTDDDLRFSEAVCRATSLVLRNFRLEAMVDKVTSHNASILENLGGGFLAVDLRGRMILCNPSARRILGIAQDLPLNLPLEQALAHAPEIAEILNKTLSTRQTVKRQDLRWTHEGKTRVLGYSTLMIQDPQGLVAGVGITFQDITNVK
jgi:adenylate cyclase